MKPKISIPPNYFYGCIVCCIPFYFVFEKLKLIVFPYNLLGLILIPIGIYLILNPWYLFKKHNTPEDFSEPKTLVMEGIYKYCRNPMYLGGVIVLIGMAITTCNLIALIMPIVFFLIMNYLFVPLEENKMQKTFGNDYSNYKASSRRWI